MGAHCASLTPWIRSRIDFTGSSVSPFLSLSLSLSLSFFFEHQKANERQSTKASASATRTTQPVVRFSIKTSRLLRVPRVSTRCPGPCIDALMGIISLRAWRNTWRKAEGIRPMVFSPFDPPMRVWNVRSLRNWRALWEIIMDVW